MANNTAISSIIPNRTAGIIYGVATILTSGVCFFYSKQITPMLPAYFKHSNFWIYLCGVAFFLAGFAILLDLLITKIAGYLLAILLFCLAVAIDLRGLFNAADEVKYMFAQNLVKDIGLIAGAIIVANFNRDRQIHRHHSRSSQTSSESKKNQSS